MNISLNWLNSYLDQPVDAQTADRVLTQLGFPLDGLDLRADDALLDVEVTSNRGDCLAHLGIAREIASGSGRSLQPPDINLPESSANTIETLTSVAIHDDAADACTLYTARLIHGVTIAPSPDWLVNRLEAVGQRPVNNVVDITNFVLQELGQPLHAFDMSLLNEQRIVVRMAKVGETFTAIDGSQHKLQPHMLVIADADKPVAVAGVMGGQDTEVSDRTTDILLESARFDPLSVRTTSRALKLASESSYRFERNVDPHGVDVAGQRAAQLILEIAGGTPTPGVIAVGQPLPAPVIITLRPDRCTSLLGYNLSVEQMIGLLTPLQLNPTWDGNVIHCTVPSHRRDLKQEVDLIEEVARVKGYDHIDVQPQMQITVRGRDPLVEAKRQITQCLAAHGYCETINFSTIAESSARPFFTSGIEPASLIDDQQRAAEPILRPSLLPSLLSCRKGNQDAGNHDVRIFEIGAVFGRENGQYIEDRHLALLADAPEPDLALRDLRGMLEELFARLGPRAQCQECRHELGYLQPAIQIVDADQPSRTVGQYGQVTDAMRQQFDLQTSVIMGWISYDWLVGAYPPERQVGGLPRFPAVERDLSIVVDESTRWQAVADAVHAVRPDMLEDLAFVATYRGKPIPTGRKSVTLRMRFRDPRQTLQHDQVDQQVTAVVDQLTRDLAAELRTT